MGRKKEKDEPKGYRKLTGCHCEKGMDRFLVDLMLDENGRVEGRIVQAVRCGKKIMEVYMDDLDAEHPRWGRNMQLNTKNLLFSAYHYVQRPLSVQNMQEQLEQSLQETADRQKKQAEEPKENSAQALLPFTPPEDRVADAPKKEEDGAASGD